MAHIMIPGEGQKLMQSQDIILIQVVLPAILVVATGAAITANVRKKITIYEQKQHSQIMKIAQAKPEDIQEIAASQIAIISNFNESVLHQAQQSFTSALLAAIIGLLFFIAAVSFLLVQEPQGLATVSIISGALVEVIAGINFYLYGKASDQFSTFHDRLDRVQQFLLANSMCESLTENLKSETRAEIALMIVNATGIPGIEKPPTVVNAAGSSGAGTTGTK